MEDVTTRDISRRRTAPTAQELPGERHALVVGIDSYAPPLSPLRHAVQDATVTADRLKDDFGFQVTLLVDGDASAQAIRSVLRRWETATQPQDSVLVFFAGHGANHPDPTRRGEGYLVPADASDDPDTWLAESEVIQHAKGMPASWVFLIFDACYTGTTFRHDIPTGARDDQVLKALVAGTEDQPVLDGGAGEHSVFTRAILDGLDGWADSGQRPDDVITADELIVYVESEVPWRSRLRGHEQTPAGGPLQGSRLARDFELWPVSARLPAPLLRNIYSPHPEDRVAAATQLGTRAPSDPADVLDRKARELIHLVEEDSALAVRVAAAGALGSLGLPAGCATLVRLLEATGEESELRAAAASGLGHLAGAPDCRQQATQALISALGGDDAPVVEAAKLGLALRAESASQLTAALVDGPERMREPVVDALACLALANPGSEEAWPALTDLDARLLRRAFMAARRLRPLWGDIVRRTVAVGLSGALGLSCGYLIIFLGIKAFNPYGVAVFSYSLLPGALAGLSLVVIPGVIRALSRYATGMVSLAAALVGGLLMGAGLGLPNWFASIGPGPVAWFLPALVSGLLLSLTLAYVPPALAASRARRVVATGPAETAGLPAVPLVAAAVVGGLSFALMRVPPALAWKVGDPPSAIVWRFGIGGAILGAALAVGWSMSPPQDSGPQDV